MSRAPDGMAADRYNERQNMKAAAAHTSGETHQLVALRPVPDSDRFTREIWGHGSREEMEELALQKAEEYPQCEFQVEQE